MKNLKRFFCLLLVFVLVVGILPTRMPASAAEFNDTALNKESIYVGKTYFDLFWKSGGV